MHRARAALAAVAADLGPRQVEVVAEQLGERPPIFDVDGARYAVDGQRDGGSRRRIGLAGLRAEPRPGGRERRRRGDGGARLQERPARDRIHGLCASGAAEPHQEVGLVEISHTWILPPNRRSRGPRDQSHPMGPWPSDGGTLRCIVPVYTPIEDNRHGSHADLSDREPARRGRRNRRARAASGRARSFAKPSTASSSRRAVGRREAILREAAGIWRDRTDLPDLDALRRGWDRD